MNPRTGEIRGIVLDELADIEPQGFEVLPDGLQKIATLKMRRAAELATANGYTRAEPAPVKVNLRSSTPLAKWAKQKRRDKIAAKSRRVNRNKR